MEPNHFREKHSFYLKPFVQSKTKKTGTTRNELKQGGTTWIEREPTVISWNETELAKASTKRAMVDICSGGFETKGFHMIVLKKIFTR